MLTDKQRDALTDEELEILHLAEMSGSIATWTLIKTMESLAKSRIKSEARREMLEEYEWVYTSNHSGWICLECRVIHKIKDDKDMPHEPDCALDALIKEK